MIFTLFTAAWTTLFAFAAVIFVLSGSLSFFAGIASSLIWLIITIIFWVSNDRPASILSIYQTIPPV